MVRFAARTCPIMDPCEQIKRGEAVTNGLRRLLLKGIKMDGVVCATVILRKDFLTWNSFGVCKESTFVSSISELPNLPFHSYDVRNRLSVAYAVACACSDMITSKMKKYKCKGKGERIEVVKLSSFVSSIAFKLIHCNSLFIVSQRYSKRSCSNEGRRYFAIILAGFYSQRQFFF